MKKLITIMSLAVFMTVHAAFGMVINVPADYGTIQDAIEAAYDGDVVIIAPDIYSGSGNVNLNFKGKAITVQSSDPGNAGIVSGTVIDCGSLFGSRGFVFFSGETADSTVKGLTITNGNQFMGGAIYCYNGSSPVIGNCVLTGNKGVFGGAVAFGNNDSRPVLANCVITGNTAMVGGGGLYFVGSSPTVTNSVIAGNYAPHGGAIYSQNPGDPVIAGCTIAGNAASNTGGGVYCYNASNLDISNSIFWGNTAAFGSEMFVGYMGATTSVQISYCDIQGSQDNILIDSGSMLGWGQGNIDVDPWFVQAGYVDDTRNYVEGDWHLMKNSPCIDAGDPAYLTESAETDIDGNARISGAAVDLGADEYETGIEIDVRIMPKTLNLSSKGNYINCNIAIEDGYDITDIDVSTIMLNGQILPEWTGLDEEDQKLIVKFDREQTEKMLSGTEGEVSLSVKGKLTSGQDFEGTDTINVMTKGGKK